MEKDLIYDVGMCDGSDTANYLRAGYRVVAVEADPSLVQRAERRFRQAIKAGRLTLVNCGIAPQRGTATFYVNDQHPVWNSFDEAAASRDGTPYRAVTITCMPFADLLATYGVPFYLKIDIEGYDHHCLDALDPARLPRYVSCEADTQGTPDNLSRLHALGYTKFKCISQDNFLPIAVPFIKRFPTETMPLNDRLYFGVRYNPNFLLRVFRKLGGRAIAETVLNPARHLRYEIGSSGPFGADTPGEWLSYADVLSVYNKVYTHYRQQPDWSEHGFWCDFHATR